MKSARPAAGRGFSLAVVNARPNLDLALTLSLDNVQIGAHQADTNSYLAEMTTLVDAVLDSKSPPVSGEDGRIAVVLGLAAQKSLRENRPVRVAEVE